MQAKIENELKVLELQARNNNYFIVEYKENIFSITDKRTENMIEINLSKVKEINHITAFTKMIKLVNGGHFTFSLVSGYSYVGI